MVSPLVLSITVHDDSIKMEQMEFVYSTDQIISYRILKVNRQ